MKKTIIILAFCLLTSFSNILFACDCKERNTVMEELKYTDAVFVGTIISKKTVILGDTSVIAVSTARYDLLVQKIYKGKITSDTVTIYTGFGVSDCGLPFKVGKKYIVYGQEEDYTYQELNLQKVPNTFWANSCSRTSIYSPHEAEEIEKYARPNFGNQVKKIPMTSTANIGLPKLGLCA